ncbi:MAG: hypothetical protein D3923_05180, partial [Candidatus Electrothrix sp. AR3]|nr:hypothetical protein [Candidatus Electrothrix sp. AR3]
MILFCEECGQRNSITLTPALIENNSFRCEFCRFRSPFPFLDQNKNSTSSNSSITWQPEVLNIPPNAGKQETSFQVNFDLGDIQIPELTVEPFHQFSHLITVNKKDIGSFTIHIKPLDLDKKEDIPPGYNGSAIIFCEENIMTW